MELFLNILKLIGIAVAGIMGIIGTLKETKDKKGRLTKFGKYIALLTVLGLVIAIASELCDEYIQKQKDQDTTAQEQAAANQISELSSSLQNANDKLTTNATQIVGLQTQITNLLTQAQKQEAQGGEILIGEHQQASQTQNNFQRLTTHFQSIAINKVVYELPESDPVVEELKNYCRQCVSDTNNLINFANVYHFDPYNPFSNFPNLNPDAYGETDRYECHNISLLAASTTNRILKEFLHGLKATRFIIGFNEKPLDANAFLVTNMALFDKNGSLILKSIYDLELIPKLHTNNVYLHYALPSGRIFLEIAPGEIDPSDWETDSQIFSIHDLGSSCCYVELVPSKFVSDRFSSLKQLGLVYCSLSFDEHLVFINNFTNLTTPAPINETIPMAVMPIEQDIIRSRMFTPIGL